MRMLCSRLCLVAVVLATLGVCSWLMTLENMLKPEGRVLIAATEGSRVRVEPEGISVESGSGGKVELGSGALSMLTIPIGFLGILAALGALSFNKK